MKEFVVFTRSMANKLLLMGYHIIKIDTHKRYNNTLVFIFEDSDGIREAVRTLKSE